MKNKYVIIVRIIASIFLLSATYIMTVSIPKIDEKIHKENAEIERLKDIEMASILSMLNIANITTGSRIVKLESNLVGYLNLSDELQNKVIQEIINDYKVITDNWISLITDSISLDILNNVNKQFVTIATDKDISIVEKYKQTSQIMKETRNEAINRYNVNVKTARIHKNNKEAIEKTRMKIYNWFVCLQIIGLILLGFIEIIEKSIINIKT